MRYQLVAHFFIQKNRIVQPNYKQYKNSKVFSHLLTNTRLALLDQAYGRHIGDECGSDNAGSITVASTSILSGEPCSLNLYFGRPLNMDGLPQQLIQSIQAIFLTLSTHKNALSVKSLDTSQPKSYLPLSIFWTPLDRPDKIHTRGLDYTVRCTVQFFNIKSLILKKILYDNYIF